MSELFVSVHFQVLFMTQTHQSRDAFFSCDHDVYTLPNAARDQLARVTKCQLGGWLKIKAIKLDCSRPLSKWNGQQYSVIITKAVTLTMK